jgi:hypothetical protein
MQQAKGLWALLLNNGQPEYAKSNSASSPEAPVTLDLTSSKQSLALPAFPVWVYKQA